MNYIIKGLLKKIFTQYLFIKDDGFDLQSGVIKLPSGLVNHQRINQKLKPFKIKLKQSKYNNLIITIPIMQLLSKPIKISIETFDLVIEKLYDTEENSKMQSESQAESVEGRNEKKEVTLQNQLVKQDRKEKKQDPYNSGYFRNIINRLLYNMQIFMQKINLKLVDNKESQEFREASLTINSMSIKNSLVILEANIIKKTLNLSLFHIRHTFGQLQFKDFNICLDYNSKKVNLIAILGALQINFYKIPLRKLSKRFIKTASKNYVMEKPKQKEENQLQLTLYAKISNTFINSKIVKIKLSTVELNMKKSQISEQGRINFQSLKLINANTEEKDSQSIIFLGYLKLNNEVKIYTQFEDSIIKNCFLVFKNEIIGDDKMLVVKLYHLLFQLNLNQLKILLDSIMIYQKEIALLSRLIKKMKISKYSENGNEESSKHTKKSLVSLLLYRTLFQLRYRQQKLNLFTTLTVNSQSSQDHKQLEHKADKSIKNGYQDSLFKIKVFQMGAKLMNYNICQLSELDLLMQNGQILVNGSNLMIQASLSLFDKIKALNQNINRDSLYYHQKITKLLAKQVVQLSVSQQSNQQKLQNMAIAGKNDSKLPKFYIKMNQIVLRLGELSVDLVHQYLQNKKQKPKLKEQWNFISVIELQLVNTLFSMVNSKSKLNTDIISYIYSPYTLQRTPLTNQLQCGVVFNLKSKEFNLSFKNNLVVLVQDQYMNIIYKLLDKQDVWTQFKNLTHQNVVFLQENKGFKPLLKTQQSQRLHPHFKESFFHKIDVQPFKKADLFWLNNSQFKLLVGVKRSQVIVLNKSEELEIDQRSQYFQLQRELKLQSDSQSFNEYVLKILYNKLGNISQMVLDYKYHIVSYCQDYEISLHGSTYKIERDNQYINTRVVERKWNGKWFHKLEDFIEDYKNVRLRSKNQQYDLQMLMVNEEFAILGLRLREIEVKDKKIANIYSGYILQHKNRLFCDFFVMPFLILKNQLEFDVEIQIIDKKTEQKEIFSLQKDEIKYLNRNIHFDYYMKQFIIKICILNQQGKPLYQSQFFYFNTYFMVDQKSQTSIQLRSAEKQSFKKRLIVFQQGLFLKTKLITLRNGIRFTNNTDFRFIFRIKQSNKVQNVEEIEVQPKQKVKWSFKMKRDTKVEVMLNGQIENKIEIQYLSIRESKLLSFNFYKINDKYYNILVKIQSRTVQGTEEIEIQDFVELVNLCHYVPQIKIQDQLPIKKDDKCYLPLNATSLSKYNNKALEIDDIHKIYAEIFLTAKVTDDPLKITISGNVAVFTEIIKLSSLEFMVGGDRYVFTLLKDMNYNRITFYLTDKIYSKTLNYTIINNTSQKNFLLTDDSQYIHHFIIQQQKSESTPPQKIFLKKQSFNCFVNKQNCDILFCDQHQKHLEKIDKKLLEKLGLKLQLYQFQSITLYDCWDEDNEQQVKRQISTKGVEVRIKMFKKVELTMSIKALTARQLQRNKLDVLIQDISIKNEQTKDHLLRIPQETYILLQGKMLNKDHFLLIKNLFLKCKHIIINIRRQMPYSIVNLINNLTERMGLNLNSEELENIEPRKYIQRIKKLNGEIKLKQCLNEMLILVKNLYIHQIHLSLTIELQNLSFSNVIILPQYQLTNKFSRQKTFKNEIAVYYLTNLLAKFPKLSFLMANFKNPSNAIKLFFNIREAIKQKIQAQHIIYFGHKDIPNNPFCFSIQRWNNIFSKLRMLKESLLVQREKMITFIEQDKKYLILTNFNLLWVEEGQSQPTELKQIQNIRLVKNRVSCEMMIRMKNGQKLTLIEQYKKCNQLLYHIKQLIM